MATETWIRNPQRCIKYCIAEGESRYLFDRALLNRYGRSAHTFMREHFLGSHITPEFIVLGDQGAQLYNLFTPHDKPLAVWPVWNAGSEDFETLEYYLANPPGSDPAQCSDKSVTPALRPVFGQESRVFIMGLTVNRDRVARLFAREVLETCKAFDATAHLHGQAAFSLMFGMAWDSVDWEPDKASRWGLTLPNGVRLSPNRKEEWPSFSDWVELVGSSMGEIDNQYERTRFHIRSLRWAAENYTEDWRAKRRYSPSPAVIRNSRNSRTKPEGPRAVWRTTRTIALRALPLYESTDTDRMVCNDCVLRTSCSLARADMVCALKGTEMGELSNHFGTRDANAIIDGLVKLVAMQSDRMEEGLEEERMSGERNPEVRKDMDSVFKNATALAKLIDPNLNGKGTTVTNQTLNINGTAVPANDPRQVVASAVRALEAAGVPRDQITGSMLKTLLSQGMEQQALEGVVVQNNAAQE